MKKSEQSLRDPWDIIKYMHYGSQKGGKIKRGEENLFEEILAKTLIFKERHGFINPRISIKKHDNQGQRKRQEEKSDLTYTQIPQ